MQPAHAKFNHVYYVECPEITLNAVAIRPKIRNGRFSWEDTGKGTTVDIKDIKIDYQKAEGSENAPKKITILTKEGQHITLTAMTVEIFNEKISPHVAKKPTFENLQDLVQYYLKTEFPSY